MKKNSGFTLIEVLIVVIIIGILAGLAIPNLSNLIRKNRIENQIRRIYSDMMNTRVMAMTRNREHYVVFAGNTYSVFEDTNGSGDYNAGDTQRLVRSGADTVPFTFSNTVPGNENITQNIGGQITFSPRGIMDTAGGVFGRIQITVADITPYVDCITVSMTMLRLGKLDGGGACVPR